MKKIFLLALTLILTACAATSPGTSSSAAAVEYPICEHADFKKCEIPPEDLFNGNYFRWFQTQAQPFAESELDERPWVISILGELMPNPAVPRVKGTVTAHRDITAGFTEHEGLTYKVIPFEFPDPSDPTNPEKNVQVIGLNLLHEIKKNGEIGDMLSDRLILKENDQWLNVMSIAPIITGYYFPTTQTSIPLVERTWKELGEEKLADIFERVKNGDITALRELNGLPVQINVNDSRFYR
ncbi:MAG: hypothetical protein KA480_09805 [Anaerolineales bacterium]|nr:hypothetical protein [Anaerolineales bacterium]